MKSMITILVALSLAVIASGMTQRSTVKRLQIRNAMLTSASSNSRNLQAENVRLLSIVVDTNRLEALRGETLELMRLRGTITPHRNLAGQTAVEIEFELRQNKSALLQAEESLTTEAEWVFRNRIAPLRGEIASAIMEDFGDRLYRKVELPLSLEPYRGLVLNSPEWKFKAASAPNLPPAFAKQLQTGVDAFELMPNPENWEAAAGDMHVLILRERDPRRLKTGELGKFYGVLSRSAGNEIWMQKVVWAQPEDGDFAAWEAAFPDSAN